MRYKIPVTWLMTATMEIDAENLTEAIEAAEEDNLPTDGSYVDGSFEISESVYDDYPEQVRQERCVKGRIWAGQAAQAR